MTLKSATQIGLRWLWM